MIGKLRGLVDSVGDGFLIIDVGGVGYEVHASTRTLATLNIGDTVILAIDTHVREDQIRLFGFTTETERAWFRLLQSVQGVGTKVALAVLSIMAPQDLANAIALADKAAVARTQGVGPKVAQRIVAELKDKAPALTAAGVSLPQSINGGAQADTVGTPNAEAISALTNLGYPIAQAGAAVATAQRELGEDADTATLIRRGLKELAS